MRSVAEQLRRVLTAAVAPSPIRVAISEAQGLQCAEDVISGRSFPGFDQAAVDGYAVRGVDVSLPEPSDEDPHPDPLVLPVVGDIEAGSKQPARLQPHQAVLLQTGAPLPSLADAVLPIAFTDGGIERIRVDLGVRSGDFVRKAGDDLKAGDVVVRSGTIIGPAQVGLLAAVGRDRVLVHPKPRVSVLSVGGELIDVDRTPGNGQVYDVNSYALAAAARDAGAEAHRVGIVSHDVREIKDIVEGQLGRAEVVIISGPVGGDIGRNVNQALSELGPWEVSRVAMSPGSVQGFGALGEEGVPTFFIPSNPVSALVVFEVIIRPLIRAALGRLSPKRRVIKAVATETLASVLGRTSYIRGKLMRDDETGEYLVEPLGGVLASNPHLLSQLGEANCLINIPENASGVREGESVDVIFLGQRG
ncbi:gephyrin-like molybdotransferase Glp [Segniliparus rugosus]|uniref:molybdotransferase-like divisome protein Glp n=1 Tax=Segniliparus rugosus TaxID=286804 RepID=UPI0001F03930|nr:gephyrin-like molybdotransferase Glp [Segniliparus rugosus]